METDKGNTLVLDQKISAPKSRIFFIDNLKIFLTILVIIHHVGQAYGPTGGFWPYVSSLNESMSWLGSFFPVNASFFMGLFFMISGYFLPGSFDRKGIKPFVVDKLIRFGIPMLFGLLIIQPIQHYFYFIKYSGNKPLSFWGYFSQIYLGIGGPPEGFIESVGWPELNFGHLWFVQHLLIYSLIYCLLRGLFRYVSIKQGSQKQLYISLGVIAILISSISAIVRIWYPIDVWIGIFGFIQSEVAHLPQYVVLFITGIIAYRKNWFVRIDKRVGYVFLSTGILMASIIYGREFLPETVVSAIYSYWAFYESFMSVFLCWGLIVFFREHIHTTSRIKKYLSENAFAAYIFHMPVVVSIQFVLDKVVIFGAMGKFLMVSILSVALSFLLSSVIRKIPKTKRIL